MLRRILQTKFLGDWRYLRKTVDEIGSERAIQAFIDLAVYLRLLDDRTDHSGFLARVAQADARNKPLDFGRVVKDGQPDERLYLRDLTNKVVHATNWEWDFGDDDRPKLICISNEPDRWTKAEIDILNFAAFCGGLVH